jgi:hypothetical protein
MASSGVIYGSVSQNSSRFRSAIYWKQTSQSIASNYTYITVEVLIDSSASASYDWVGTCSGFDLNVNGSAQVSNASFSTNTDNGWTYSSSSSPTGRIAERIYSKSSIKITHNDDGKKSININTNGSIPSGGWGPGNFSASGTATLNTIPRASSLTDSTPNWTVGRNITLGISSASSSFRHEVEIYVKTEGGSWDWVKQVAFNAGDTSESTSWSQADNEEILRIINGRSSAPARMLLQTFDGSTSIGSKDYDSYITVTAPEATKVTSINNTVGGNGTTVYFDQSITINLDSDLDNVHHTIRFKDGNSGTVFHEITGYKGSTYTVTFDDAEKAHIYNKIPTATELDGQIDVYTYLGSNNRPVRGYRGHDIEYRLRNAEPTFTSSRISYADVGTKSKAVTGDPSYIIQNESTLRAYVNSVATPKFGATIDRYDIDVDGKSDYLTGTGYKDFTVSSSSDRTLKIEAVDSRGYRTSATLNVKVIPYSPPTVTVTAKRLNNFEDETTINLVSSISPVKIGSTNMNSFQTATYNHKLTTASTYPTATSYGTMPTGISHTFPSKTLTLNKINSYHVQVIVSDELRTTTITKTVSTGQPILFMDSAKKSVGVNRFPNNSLAFEVQEQMYLYPSTSAGTKVGSIFSSNTYKTYINFVASAISNDPAYIMHETGSDTTNNNRGVLHLCPSDDSDGTNDYVSIHGTNDPEGIRLYTDGTAHFNGYITATGIKLTSQADVTSTSTNHGLTIGNDAGDSIKIDTNEVSSFSGGNVYDLHLNPDGGLVTINNSKGSGYKILMENGGITADGAVRGQLSHSGGYMFVDSYGSSYGSGSGRIWYDHNGGRFNFWNSSGGGATIDISNGSLKCGHIYLDSTSIIMTPPGNFDQIWYNDSNNAYYFQADAPSSKYGASGGLGMIYASSVTSSSKREWKTNIRKLKDESVETALSKVVNTEVYKYRYKHDIETEKRGRLVPQSRVGVMVEEAPEEIVNVNGDGIDLYAMNTMLWRAVQELSEQVDFLNKKMNRK